MELKQRERRPTMISAIPNMTPNDGHTIPQLGLGVFQIAPRDTHRAVSESLEIGYHHLSR